MAYIPLHHKYRPQTFADLVGQEAISTTLTNALRLEKIAPAYLFTGPRGTGKTSSARILAKSLNCMASDVPTAQPCGKCDACSAIAVGAALDIIEIDAASNTGVDNIRELIERAQYAPVQCRYKVYIIDECLTGDSLVLTAKGLARIDDRTLVGQKVLSYNDDRGTWEWKRVLRWLDRGEKSTLTIKTTHRELSCTGNHLLRTDRGWIKAQDLKVGMKILSPLDRSYLKHKNYDRSAPVVAAKNYLFPPTCNLEALSTASKHIGKNTFTSKGMASGYDARQNLLPTPQSYVQSNSDSSMAPCWVTVPLPIPTSTASYPDWLGRMELVNRNGYRTKPVDYQNCDQNYKLSTIEAMVRNPVPVKLPVIHNWQESLILSNLQEREKQLRSNGSTELPQKDLPGGISMMVPSLSAQKEVPLSICIQKDILWMRTNLLLDGLMNLATQPALSTTSKESNVIATTTLDSTHVPAADGWKIFDLMSSRQWHTSLETIESVSLAGPEKVYDLEVEDNHNFVANGLLVHNCHMLTTAAFNSLLKTLEEPPDRVVFVLATTDPQRVLPTIISRCQRFDYRRIPVEAMVKHLTYIAGNESIEIDAASVKLIAQIAQGGLRDAESLLDRLSLLSGEITPDRVYDAIGSVPERDLLDILQSIDRADPEQLLDLTRTILERGKEPLTVLQNLAGCYRDLTIAKTAPQRADLVALTSESWTELTKIAKTWQLNQILVGQKHLKDSELQLKHTTQPQLWLEIAILGLLELKQQHSSVAPNVAAALAVPARSIATPTAPPPTSQAAQPPMATPQDRGYQSSTPAAAVAPTNALDTGDITATWERVLQQLLPASRDLFKPFGTLISISEAQAIVAMKSSTMQTIAAGKVPELAKVFSNMFGRSIAVKLEVLGKIQPQSSSISPTPSPSAPPPPVELPPAPAVTPPPPVEPPPVLAVTPPPPVESRPASTTPPTPPVETPSHPIVISLPSAEDDVADDATVEDFIDDNEDLPELTIDLQPPASARAELLDALSPPQSSSPVAPADLFAEPTDFAEPPDSIDLERAANNSVDAPEEIEVDPELEMATNNVVKLFNGEVIDRSHELFDRIVNN